VGLGLAVGVESPALARVSTRTGDMVGRPVTVHREFPGDGGAAAAPLELGELVYGELPKKPQLAHRKLPWVMANAAGNGRHRHPSRVRAA